MTTLWNNREIKVFVKNTLGCECPDEVFEEIAVSQFSADASEKEATRIVVGNKLLIYVIHPKSIDNLADSIEAVGAAGRNDRDSHNYNRFRLVISSIGDTTQQLKVSKRFTKAFNTHDKMHIHFVNEGMLVGL